MPPFELYIHFLYLSSCTMGAVMYGDIIPLALSEQLFTFIAMFTARIYLAFLFAEAASYLSSLHKSYSIHIQNQRQVVRWMQLNGIPQPVVKRVNAYYDLLWSRLKGLEEGETLNDLPPVLRHEVRMQMFQRLLASVPAFPKNQPGAISTLVDKLILQVIPKGEYVIRVGELGMSMFFIVDGEVEVLSAANERLKKLGKGNYFGEMAIITGKPQKRSASVLCLTHVSVAKLILSDFKTMCQAYPAFEKSIKEEAQKREIHNTRQMTTKSASTWNVLQKGNSSCTNRKIPPMEKPEDGSFDKSLTRKAMRSHTSIQGDRLPIISDLDDEASFKRMAN